MQIIIDDEAKRLAEKIGSRLLYLIHPGSLVERQIYLEEKYSIRVSYNSYDSQWKSLVSQLGLEEAIKLAINEFLGRTTSDSLKKLKEALYRPLTEEERNKYGLWIFTDYKTGIINDLGKLVLRCLGVTETVTVTPVKKIEQKSVKPTIEKENVSLHSRIQDMLVELGKRLGYRAVKEYYHSPSGFRWDVAWFKPPTVIPVKIFEVQIGGDIDKALLRLKHAYDLFKGCDLFLVALNIEDLRLTVQSRVSGAFHEIEDKLTLLDIHDIETLFRKYHIYKKLLS